MARHSTRLVAAALALLLPASAVAQPAPPARPPTTRTAPPAAGKPAPPAAAPKPGALKLPTVERFKLENGLEVAYMRHDAAPGESSAVVRARVLRARRLQEARCGTTNARLDQAQTDAHCRLAGRDFALLERAVESLQLSARSLHRILRVARTIADLAGCESIETPHLTEAIGYRRLERGRERAAA